MKLLSAAILILSLFLASCGQAPNTANAGQPGAGDISRADLGYAIGVSIGGNLKQYEFDFDYDAFLNGVKDQLENKTTRIKPEDANNLIQAALAKLTEKKSRENMQKGTAFLEQNKAKKGVITTASGLQYEVLKEGAGKKPTQTSQMTLHYQGTLLDGTVFDSSYKRGQPATFSAGGVIPGFSEGLLLMSPGAKYKFYIPSALAYGAEGQGQIPPGSTLIFEVELISFIDKP
jgi:FKBP-type peptidyl-prolyl cis-trans isomerase